MRDFIRLAGARQVELFDFPKQAMTHKERAEYFRVHVLAASDEMHEVLDCVDWKPWSRDEGAWKVDKETLADEIADVLAFIGNICFAAGISDGVLDNAIDRNDEKIRRRVADGYAARKRTNGDAT